MRLIHYRVGISPELIAQFSVFDVSSDPQREPLSLSALVTRSNGFIGVFDGNSGDDVLFGGIGRDRQDGGSGNDTLFGFAGDDRLWGDGGEGSSSDFDQLFAGAGNDDLIGGQGVNHLYAWSFDPTDFDPLAEQQGEFGVFSNSAGQLYASQSTDGLLAENTGLNRILGGPNADRLYGGTGVDFLYGNGGGDVLYRSNGQEFESLDESLAGDEWKQYARETGQVWYVSGTGAADEISIDFVTEPGLLSDHHLVTRLTENNGSFSFAAQVRMDFGALDQDGNLIWEASDLVIDANRILALKEELDNSGANDREVSQLQQDLQQAETALVGNLLPPEGDFLAIIIDALGGNDFVNVGPTVQKSVWVDGGAGDDVITIRSGNAILPDVAEVRANSLGLRGRNDLPELAYSLFEPMDVSNRNLEFHSFSMDSPLDQDWFRFSFPVTDSLVDLQLASLSPADELGLVVYRETADGLEPENDLTQLSPDVEYLLSVTNPRSVPTQYDLRFDFGYTEFAGTDMSLRRDSIRRDIILGGDGDDVLQGGGGEDWVFGGAGNDVLSGGLDRQASDLLFAGPGDDTFQILTDALPLLGNQPNTQFDPATATYIPTHGDQMIGGDGQDRVLFLGGDVDRRGFEVPDFAAIRYNTALHRYEFTNLLWDIGEQTFAEDADGQLLQHYLFFQTRDVESMQVALRSGNDVFHADEYVFPGSNASWGIDLGDAQQGATIADVRIEGGLGDDELAGGAGNDSIFGGPGNDLLVGGLGNDDIDGGQGSDWLFGNAILVQAGQQPPAFSTPEEVAFATKRNNSELPDDLASEAYAFDLSAPFTVAQAATRPGSFVDRDDAPLPVSSPGINELAHGISEVDSSGVLQEIYTIGDINADGFDDFILLGTEVSHIAFGPVQLDQIQALNDIGDLVVDHQNLGVPARGVGDINGDGVADLAFVRSEAGFTEMSIFHGAGAESDSSRCFNNRHLVETTPSKILRFNDAQINPLGLQLSIVTADSDGLADLLLTSSSTRGTTLASTPAGLPSEAAFEQGLHIVGDHAYVQVGDQLMRSNETGDFEPFNIAINQDLEAAIGPWLLFSGVSAYNVELERIFDGLIDTSEIENALVQGNRILYNGFQGQLYRWDATTETAEQIDGSGRISESAFFGGGNYFSFDVDGHGKALYAWAGDEVWAVEGHSPSISDPTDFAVLDNVLYFSAASRHENTGRELWKYDGSSISLAGPVRSGSEGVNPRNTVAYGGSLYFQCDLGVEGNELYRFTPNDDGGEIELVADLNPTDGGSSQPRNFTIADGFLYFVANLPIDDEGHVTPRLLRFDGDNVLLASSVDMGGNQAVAAAGDFLFYSFVDEHSIERAGRVDFNRIGAYVIDGHAISQSSHDSLRYDGTTDEVGLSRFEFTDAVEIPSGESVGHRARRHQRRTA